MMKLAALLVALATACTTDATPVLHRVELALGTADNRLTIVEQGDLHFTSEADDASICDVLPPDGACAAACDPEALAQFIPPGVCAVIGCQLTDGRTVKIGGCNP
jgi:hypothetical protein